MGHTYSYNAKTQTLQSVNNTTGSVKHTSVNDLSAHDVADLFFRIKVEYSLLDVLKNMPKEKLTPGFVSDVIKEGLTGNHPGKYKTRAGLDPTKKIDLRLMFDGVPCFDQAIKIIDKMPQEKRGPDTFTYILDKMSRGEIQTATTQSKGVPPQLTATTQSKTQSTKTNPQLDFSFDELKNTFDQYDLVKITNNGKEEYAVSDKKTGVITTDPMLIDKAKFAFQWFVAVKNSGLSLPSIDDNKANYDYVYENYAFNENSKNVYDNLMSASQSHLRNTGNVDPQKLIQSMSKYMPGTDYARIIEHLFSQDKYAQATANYFRHATPDAKQQTQITPALKQGYTSS